MIYSPIIFNDQTEYKAIPVPVVNQILRENVKYKKVCKITTGSLGLKPTSHLGLRLIAIGE